MDCCAHGYDDQFDTAQAAKDLKRFRKEGPDPMTRALVNLLRASDLRDATLLDIGGGIGAIHHELLDSGARSAVHADASAPYIRTARDEAERRGHGERLEFVYGDFVAMAESIAPADVVTLDKVICCYADMEALVAASAARARRLYGAVFPRDRWFLRVGFRAMNLLQRMRRRAFRVYLHSPEAIDAAVRRQGLERRSVADTFVWRVAVYAATTLETPRPRR